jgi:hypothetical protein
VSSASFEGVDGAVRKLQRRAAEVRARAAVRRWEYRQRHHAKGSWYRLRRVLVDANEAFVISEADAAALLEEGYQPQAVGLELQPPKLLLFVPRERVLRIAGARQIALHLNAELLTARFVALVGFGPTPE